MIHVSLVPLDVLGDVLLDIAQNLVLLFSLHIFQELQILCTLPSLEGHAQLRGIGTLSWHIERSLFRLWVNNEHMHMLSNHSIYAYLLVDEVLIIVLNVELALHLLDLSALLEEMPLHGEHFPPSNFTLAHQSNELASIFQLFAKTSELFGTLRISTTSFADLANLASTETDKWITVVGVLTSLELRRS